MDFSAVALTEAQQAFADEVRAFLDEHLTEEVYAGARERADHFDEGLYWPWAPRAGCSRGGGRKTAAPNWTMSASGSSKPSCASGTRRSPGARPT